MRIDKFLSNLKYGSRKEIKEIAKKGRITVNDVCIRDSSVIISLGTDVVKLDQEVIYFKENLVLMMNKPQGVVSANNDVSLKTVMELIEEPYNRFELNIAGRLDKDTEGLLLLTNSGTLLHQIISPSNEISKTYYVTLLDPLFHEDILEKGVTINDGKNMPYKTLPAKIKKIDATHVYISIMEGKFHQVKRMFEAIHNEVTFLKRVSIGNLQLDESLKEGDYRECSLAEIEQIFAK